MESGKLYPRKQRPPVMKEEDEMNEVFDPIDSRMGEIKIPSDDSQNSRNQILIANGINQRARNTRKTNKVLFFFIA